MFVHLYSREGIGIFPCARALREEGRKGREEEGRKEGEGRGGEKEGSRGEEKEGRRRGGKEGKDVQEGKGRRTEAFSEPSCVYQPGSFHGNILKVVNSPLLWRLYSWACVRM